MAAAPFLSQPAVSATGINHTINFQGKLVNPNGTNVSDNTYSITFKLYNVSSGGSAIWTENDSVTTTNGIFQLALGTACSFTTAQSCNSNTPIDFNNDSIYLGITVTGQGDSEMTPRIQFTAVPYAFNSEKLGGLDKTGFIQNTTSQQASSNFNISGTGVVGTSLTTPILQSAASTALTITGNAASTWSTSAGNITLQAGSGTVSLGTSTALTATGALAITGGTTLSLQSTTTSAVTLDSGTTGDVNVGTNTSAKNIKVGGTGANVITIGDTQTAGSISLGAAMTSGTISIGGTGAQTGTISIGTGTGAQTINIATGGTGAKTLTVGSTAGTSPVLLQSGTSGILVKGSTSTAALQVQSSGSDVLLTVNTSTNRVTIGNATAAAGTDSTLLVVDSATTANAPTGTNGGIFYDSTLNKFRCFENGAYTNCIGAASSTTLQQAYNNSSNPAQINMADSKPIEVTNASAQDIIVRTINDTTNIFTNGGFESSVSPWTNRGVTDQVTRDTTKSFHGGASAKLNNNGNSNGGIFYQFNLAANTAYTFSGYLFDGGSSGSAVPGWRASTISNNDCSTVFPLTTGWIKFTCSFNTTGATLVSGQSGLYVTTSVSSAVMYLDDARLEAASSGTNYNAGSIQLNGVITSPTTFQNASNSALAFQVQTAAGSTIFDVDSLNSRIGIGTSSPRYTFDLAGSSSAGQFHIANGTNDDGVYLNAQGASTGYFSQGAVYNGTNYVAKATTASIQGSAAGVYTISTDSGLTVGNTFTPTTRLTILTNGNTGIGLSPSFKLDVNGDVNIASGSAYKINGTNICSSTGCIAGAGSGNYIQNGTALQTAANFNIQAVTSGVNGSIGGIIRGASGGQTVDLFQLQDSSGVIMAAINATGQLVFGPSGSQDTNLYRSAASTLKTDDNLIVLGTITSGLINGQTISSAASFTGTVNAATGYQIAGGAASGNFLRGNGTNFVSSAIQSGDIPAGSGNYIQNGTSLQSSANFRISGTGRADTSISTPSIVTASGDLTVDPTGDTVIVGSVATNASAALNVTNSTPSSLLFVRNDGNIGVNTNSPSTKLDVRGTTQVVAGSTTALQVIDTNTTPVAVLTVDTINHNNTSNLSNLLVTDLAQGSAPSLAAGNPSTGANNVLKGDGTTYYYKVTALNGSREALASTESAGFSGTSFSTISAPASALTSSGNVGAGISCTPTACTYQVTFVTPNGETTVGPTSAGGVANTGTFSSISLTSIPTGPTGTTARKIYRSTNGSAFALTQTINDNTTTSATDSNTAPSGAVPGSNTARTNTNSMTVTFSTVTGATSYNIYRGTSSGGENVVQTGVTSSPFTDNGFTTAGSPPTSSQVSRVGIGTSSPTTNLDVRGDALFKNGTNSTTAFSIQNSAGTSNLFVADTTNTRVGIGATPATSLLTIGTNTTADTGGIIFGTDSKLYRSAATTLATNASFQMLGGQFTNNGSTLNTGISVGPFGSNQAIGTAAATVDVATTITVSASTTGLTLSLPNPTSTTTGRLVYILNPTGGNAFTMHGVSVTPGSGQIYLWNGSAWILGASGGAGTAVTLQAAYDGGNTLTTSNARNITVTLADTATDSNFLVNIASGSTSKFAVQYNGSDVYSTSSGGNGNVAPIISSLGASFTILRSATNVLIQDSGGSNTLINADTANLKVGIGTTPSNKLDVVNSNSSIWAASFSTTGASGSSNLGVVQIARSDSTVGRSVAAAYMLQNASSASKEYGRIGAGIEDNTASTEDGFLSFMTTTNGSTGNERLRIGNTGDVTFKSAAASTSAFQIQNTAGNSLLTLDSTNNRLNFITNIAEQDRLTSSTTLNSLNTAVTYPAVVVANGYIYAIGGSTAADSGTPTNAIQYAKILHDGTLSTWTTSSVTYPQSYSQIQCVFANGYIYCFGGQTNIDNSWDLVYSSKVNSDGSLSAWTSLNSMVNNDATATNAYRHLHSAVTANGYVYIIGGKQDSAAVSSVLYAKIGANGTLGSWAQSVNSLPAATFGHASVAADGYIYVIGGNTGQTTVYYARVLPSGETTTWSTSGTGMSIARTSTSAVVSNGYIYEIAGSTNGTNTSVGALSSSGLLAVNNDGSITSSSNNTSLTQSRMGHGSVTANGYIFTVGGNSGTPAVLSSVEVMSTPRLAVRANLDLVSVSGSGMSDSGSGGELTAGNTNVVGKLNVQGSSNFAQNVGITGSLTVNGDVSAYGSITLTGGITTSNISTPSAPTVAPQGTGGVITWAYKVTGVNAVGGETPASAAGQTTAGNASLSSTNFNKITWSAVPGATNYKIYRTTAGGTSPTNIGLIGQTGGLVFNDTGISANTSFTAPTADKSGNVGIGTTASTDKVEVAGDVRVGTSGTNGCIKRFDGTGIVGTCSSDERLKKNIASIDDLMENFGKLRVVNYEWRADEFPEYGFGGGVKTGLIAQEVEMLFPNLVTTDQNGYRQLDYSGLGLLNIKATTELVGKVDDHEARIKAIEDKLGAGTTGGSYIQSGGNASLNNVNISGTATIANLHVTMPANFDDDVTVKGHIITAGDALTTQIQTAAGTPDAGHDAATVSVDGNDTLGTITIKTSDHPTAGEVAKIIFAKSYAKKPKVLISPSNEKASGLKFFRGTTTLTDFMLNFTDAPEANTEYQFDYFIGQ